MTAYFDQRHAEVRAIEATLAGTPGGSKSAREAGNKFEELDRALVRDVSICAEFDGFPEDLRDQIDRLVLAKSPECQPLNARGIEIETLADRAKLLHFLIWELHSIFHDLATRRIGSFTDDPRAALWVLTGRAEERRERLAAVENPFELWSVAEGRHVLFRAHSEHIPPLLGPGAHRVASFPVVSLEEAIRAKCGHLGIQPPEDMEAASDEERRKLNELIAASLTTE